MRKKIFLVFLLCFLPISLMALENTSNRVIVGNVEKKDNDSNTNSDENVINIGFNWNSLKFIYNYETDYNWDETTHKYTISKKEYWLNNSDKITVTNNSKKSVTVRPKYVGSISDIKGSFDNSALTINPRVSKNIVFSIKGSLSKKYSSYTKAGAITLQFE